MKIIIQYTQNVVLKTGRVHAVFVMCSVPTMEEKKGLEWPGIREVKSQDLWLSAVEGEVGMDAAFPNHALLHFPFFSLRWNFLRRLVQTSLHWITRLFLSATKPMRSAPGLLAPPPGPTPGPAPGPVPPSAPPITKNRLLIWILGHLQARSFMCTHKMLSPLFKGSPRLLYTATTLTENLAQSPTVSMSSTFTWTAGNTCARNTLRWTLKTLYAF